MNLLSVKKLANKNKQEMLEQINTIWQLSSKKTFPQAEA
jgi:hypothetical protein